MRRFLAAGLLSLVFVPAALVLHPSEAAACSCLPWPSALEAAQSVDLVFTAKLVSVADAPKDGQYGIQYKIFTFEVTRTFKGQIDAQVNVFTADNSAACGRSYGAAGTEWLIFASVDGNGQINDNLCSRSKSLDQAAADIAELEANADKLDDEPPPPSTEQPGPAEPEPEPLQPDPFHRESTGGDVAPEPTAKPQRCAVVDATPANGLAGFLTLALGLVLVRRRRA